VTKQIGGLGIVLFAWHICAKADSYTFTTFADGSNGAQPTAINNSGQIAGNSSCGRFIYSGGNFSYPMGCSIFYAGGINDAGVVSGTFPVSGQDHGVIINGNTTTYFSVPGSVRTLGYQINDSGIVDGYYTTNGPGSPFIYTYNGSTFTTIIPPGATFAFPAGFNNSGELVGEYGTTADTLVQFFCDGSTFHTINFPGSSFTSVTGISNSGIIFGQYGSAGSVYDFFDMNGIYSTVSAPGAITGMNDAGVIVGSYSSDGETVGFIGTPGTTTPEPTGAALVSIGGSLIAVLCRRRAKVRQAAWQRGLVARTKALINLPSTCGAIESTSTPCPERKALASSTS
jgi:hypothetical protein